VRRTVTRSRVVYVYLTLFWQPHSDRPWLVLLWRPQPQQPWLSAAARAGGHPCCNRWQTATINRYEYALHYSTVRSAPRTHASAKDENGTMQALQQRRHPMYSQTPWTSATFVAQLSAIKAASNTWDADCHAKTAEWIDVLFGVEIHGDQRNIALDGAPHLPWRVGSMRPLSNYFGHLCFIVMFLWF